MGYHGNKTGKADTMKTAALYRDGWSITRKIGVALRSWVAFVRLCRYEVEFSSPARENLF